MKKIISISLLLIFLFNTMGYYIAFQVIQCEIEDEVEQKIKQGLYDDRFAILTINENDVKNLEWIYDDKEVKFNGRFYDVIKSEQKLESLILYCISDQREDKLFAILDQLINVNIVDCKPTKDNSSKKITDHVVELYFPPNEICFYNPLSPNKIFHSLNLIYPSFFNEINSPPPEFI